MLSNRVSTAALRLHAFRTTPLRTVALSGMSRATSVLYQQRRGYAEPRHSDGDLGGPGGSETYPDSKPVHRRYARITAAGVAVGIAVFAVLKTRQTKNAEKAGR
ncbi:hypothetical protein VTK73DRAFT_572 [Phialemonium thermophilum]|uniref:Uncharacterized protein n=1 Tax=Phialemonium thermophilum TaxID=223376 RepID=A0ABR3XEG4_9PEZI